MNNLKVKYNTIGIYRITNLINNKFYIGSSTCLKTRISKHKSLLLKGKHYNKHLQSAINKYNIKNFKVEQLETCDINNLLQREQFYIDYHKPHYNKCKIAGNTIGYKHTQEHLNKVRKSIIQLDLQGNFIGEYSCCRIAGEKQNLHGKTIGECARGKYCVTYKKYIFIFKEDYINKNIEDILFERIEMKNRNLYRTNYINKDKEYYKQLNNK